MSNTNTGGPAFPQSYQHTEVVAKMYESGELTAGQLKKASSQLAGMTLRDYFAAKASEDDIRAHIWKGFNEVKIRTAPDGKKYETSAAATWTREQAKYRYADAMLKAREA